MSKELSSAFGPSADRGFNPQDEDLLRRESVAREVGRNQLLQGAEARRGAPVAMPGMVRGADLQRQNSFQASLAGAMAGVGHRAASARTQQMLQDRAAFVDAKLRERRAYEMALAQAQQRAAQYVGAVGRRTVGGVRDYMYENPPEGHSSMPDGRWVRTPTVTPEGTSEEIWGPSNQYPASIQRTDEELRTLWGGE